MPYDAMMRCHRLRQQATDTRLCKFALLLAALAEVQGFSFCAWQTEGSSSITVVHKHYYCCTTNGTVPVNITGVFNSVQGDSYKISYGLTFGGLPCGDSATVELDPKEYEVQCLTVDLPRTCACNMCVSDGPEK